MRMCILRPLLASLRFCLYIESKQWVDTERENRFIYIWSSSHSIISVLKDREMPKIKLGWTLPRIRCLLVQDRYRSSSERASGVFRWWCAMKRPIAQSWSKIWLNTYQRFWSSIWIVRIIESIDFRFRFPVWLFTIDLNVDEKTWSER